MTDDKFGEWFRVHEESWVEGSVEGCVSLRLFFSWSRKRRVWSLAEIIVMMSVLG